MNWISKDELEKILKECFEQIKKEIAKSPGIGIGTGGGGVGTGTGGTKPPITETDEQKWNQFFRDKGIKESDKNNWKNLSGLTPEEASDAYDKSEWTELDDSKISDLKNNKAISYTDYDYKARNIHLVDNPKQGIVEYYEHINAIKSSEDYSDLKLKYDDKSIEAKVRVIQTTLPDSLNIEILKGIREQRLAELFKKAFEEGGASKLKDDEIDEWRKGQTGLDKMANYVAGKTERQVFNNGWTDPDQIKDGLLDTYKTEGTEETENDIDVLKVEKNALDEAHKLLAGIKKTTNFKELSKWKDDNKKALEELKKKDAQLPEDNLTAIKARKLWDNNWEAADIKDNGKGNIRVVVKGKNIDGYDNILTLENKSTLKTPSPPANKTEQISEEQVAWRTAMGGSANPPRKEPLDSTGKNPDDNAIMDAWFKLTKSGSGTILDNNGKQQKNVLRTADIQRTTFSYFLDEFYNEEKGDGLEPDELNKALENLKKENQLEPKSYNPITPELLNKLFAYDKSTGEWTEDELIFASERDFYPDLKKRNAYDINEERPDIVKEETEWGLKGHPNFAPWKKGTNLLKYSFGKNGDWDPDNPTFCKYGKRKGWVREGKPPKWVEREIDGVEDGDGHLAIVTGGGKSTKIPNCVCKGGKQNIIIVAPTAPLAEELAATHRSDWMQKFGCPYHAELVYDKSGNEIGYKSHGEYEVAHNDLTYWIDGDESTQGNPVYKGKKGISVLYWPCFLGYINRSLCRISTIAEGTIGRDKDHPYIDPKTGKEEWIKQKLIPKEETTVFTDEAHFPEYRSLIDWSVKLGYNIIKMSATFPKNPFSITSNYPRTIRKVDGFQTEHLVYEENVIGEDGKVVDGKAKGDPILGEDNKPIDKWTQGNTFAFIKNVEEFKEKREKILKESGIAYCILDETLEGAARGISEGMINGLIIGDKKFEMGFTFSIRSLILTCWQEISKLGGDWTYGKPSIQNITWASFVQQFGRIGRTDNGDGYTLEEKMLAEPKPAEELVWMVIDACLAGKLNTKGGDEYEKKLKNSCAKLSSIHLIRNALALPGRLFGKPPEEVLIGIKGKNNFDSKGNPIITIEFGNVPDSGNPNKTLIDKHLGRWFPKKVDKDYGQDILKLMITTWIRTDSNFPTKLDIEKDNPLVKDSEIESEEVQRLVNGLIEEKLIEIHNKAGLVWDKKNRKYEYKHKKVFEETVKLCRLAYKSKVNIEGEKITIVS